MTEKEKEYSKRYQKEKCKGVYLKLHKTRDADIIEILEAVDNKQGFIKDLIRQGYNDYLYGEDSSSVADHIRE